MKNQSIIKDNKEKQIKKLLFKIKEFIGELPKYNHSHFQSNKIFWCWLQGEELAPKISKACLNSVKRNCKKHEIIVITKNNINQYVHIPHYILTKLQKKYIGLAHFSDLLRLELLLKYGGTWIDSTVLITKYEYKFFHNELFFFQKRKKNIVSGSNWFINSEKESPILRTTLDGLYQYWARNNKICHYFLFHIIFGIACNKYKKDYQNIPFYSSKPVHLMQEDLYKRFKILKYKYIIKYVSIHKLTRKHMLINNKGSFYHHILERYLF